MIPIEPLLPLAVVIPLGLVAGWSVRFRPSPSAWRWATVAAAFVAGTLIGAWWMGRVNGECITIAEPLAAVGPALMAAAGAAGLSWIAARNADPRRSGHTATRIAIVAFAGFGVFIALCVGTLLYPALLGAFQVLVPICDFMVPQ